MREYASISPHFWLGGSGRRLRKMGPEAQVVAMYLITSPHANALGLYYLPRPLIAHETGLNSRTAEKAMDNVVRSGFCDYDDQVEVVWVKNMAKFQVGRSLKAEDKRIKWICDELLKVPRCGLVFDFIKKYKDDYHLNKLNIGQGASKGHRRGIEGASKGHFPKKGKNELEQEQEQEQEMDNINVRPETDKSDQAQKNNGYSDEFEAWWKELARKEKKPRAWTVWQRMQKKGELPDVDFLIETYRKLRLKKGQDWKKEGAKYHPLPTTLLGDRYWEDVKNIAHQGGSHVGLDEKDYDAGEYRATFMDEFTG